MMKFVLSPNAAVHCESKGQVLQVIALAQAQNVLVANSKIDNYWTKYKTFTALRVNDNGHLTFANINYYKSLNLPIIPAIALYTPEEYLLIAKEMRVENIKAVLQECEQANIEGIDAIAEKLEELFVEMKKNSL